MAKVAGCSHCRRYIGIEVAFLAGLPPSSQGWVARPGLQAENTAQEILGFRV